MDVYGQMGMVDLNKITSQGVYVVRFFNDGKEVAEPVKLIKVGSE